MKLNLPNKLTVLRLFLVPVFIVMFIVFGGETWGRIASAAIFAIASFTDFLDGKIARKYSLITDFGKFLDPLADKFMVIGALVSILCVTEMGLYRTLFFCVTIIVVFRELAVTSMRLVVATSADKVVIAANWLGKIKTGTQIAFIIISILEPIFWGEHWVSYALTLPVAVMTIWSGLTYIVGYWKYLDASK